MPITDDAPTIAGARAPRWRLRFPADGSAVFELTAAFDESAVRALRERIAELAAHERLGLVIDLSAAGALDAEQRRWLLRIVRSAPRCPLVVVTPVAAVLAARLAQAGGERRVIAVPTRAGVRPALRGGVQIDPWSAPLSVEPALSAVSGPPPRARA